MHIRPDPLMFDPVLNPQLRQQDADADKWIVGLDLGQAQDFTALVGLHRMTRQAEGESFRVYDCPYIKRWALGTVYTQIVEDLRWILPSMPRATLVLDGTGCGRPVVDMVRKAGLPCTRIVPVIITGGATAHYAGGYAHAPKRDLVGAVMSVTHKKRLHIARTLPEAAILQKELRAFTAKITTSGNERFENDWRIAPHDDIILALALALWQDRQTSRFRMWTGPEDCQGNG
jgi:hypothetical protein